jgi:hypothetical protein
MKNKTFKLSACKHNKYSILKTMLLASCGMIFSNSSNAQFVSSGGTTSTTDNVGIGTSSPGAKLEVNGDVIINNPVSSTFRSLMGHTAVGALSLAANTSSVNGANIELYGDAFSGREGQIHLISYGTSGTGTEFISYNPSATTWHSIMKINNDGTVNIGSRIPTSPFTAPKLSVDGTVMCTQAIVQTSSWADYVFNADYNLPSLTEVAQYITANKHLPDVPSEQTVLTQGVDVSNMNKILLQKVEELTLYMIQLQKKNEELEARINSLHK